MEERVGRRGEERELNLLDIKFMHKMIKKKNNTVLTCMCMYKCYIQIILYSQSITYPYLSC